MHVAHRFDEAAEGEADVPGAAYQVHSELYLVTYEGVKVLASETT